MTQKRLIPRTWTWLGLVLGVLALTAAMLTLVHAQNTLSSASIAIVKKPDQTVLSGSTATFSIAITNTGDVTLTNVAVSDALAPNCTRPIGVLPDLVPGQSTSYECALTNVTAGFTNSATVVGTDTLASTEATDSDTALVTVVSPAIAIAKMPDTQTVVSGTSASFTIAVTNTGDVPLTGVTVSDAQVPNCATSLGVLAADKSVSYDCTLANVTDGFTNSASVAGTPPVGGHVTHTDDATVEVINPRIQIAKTPDTQAVVSGSTVTFTIAVVNNGNVPLANVTVWDGMVPDCAASLGLMLPDASVSYDCTLANVTDGFTNQATVTGTPLIGDDVTDADTATVIVINPGIQIAKTPDTQTIAKGTSATFTIAVLNSGDARLTNVTVSDAMVPDCAASLGALAADASVSYDCTLANVTDGFVNSASVTGKPLVGSEVTDADAAMVRLDETQTCPTDMIAYWRLDETSGSTYDDFYYGHDGECAGQCPTPTSGHVNGGQTFNGSSTGINVPVVPGDDSFNWSNDDSFSIEFWMQASAGACSGSNEVVLGRQDDATEMHWWAGCWDGGQAAFYLTDNGGTLAGVIGTTDLTAGGDWHHVVATRDAIANEIRVYVDGKLEDFRSTSYSEGFDSPTAELNIGWLDRSHGYHFEGIIDEVAVYDKALPSDDIWQHYIEGLAGRWYCQDGTPFAPVIVSTPTTHAVIGRPYSYDVEAVGNPDPTYTLVTYPSGMTINTATGLISWVPSLGQEGDHSVEVNASNGVGTDTQGFTISVAEGTVCPADMIAYWKLDETGGVIYDDFYNAHDGLCDGDPACPDPVFPGHLNGGQEFHKSGTGIEVPADAAFDWGVNDSFSIEFWMQTDNTSTCSGNEVVIGRYETSRPRWWVGCQDGGNAYFYLEDNAGQVAEIAGSTVTDGAWHHVVAVRDASASVIRLHVDGELKNSTPETYSAGFDSPIATLTLGWFDTAGGNRYFFDGIVDEVALYDRALSTDEIDKHYIAGEAGAAYCFNPDIALDKTADATAVYVEDMVTYTYAVTNPGDAPFAVASPSDDECSAVTFLYGDDDGDNHLDPIETWFFECSMMLTADITNTATVTGTHFLGGTVSDTDTVSVDVISPAIALDKTADPTAIYAGETVTVTYTYTVTNPGDDPLSDVDVSDDKCSPVVPAGDGDDNYRLDPGEVWTYTCSTTLSTGTTNTATATGIDSASGTWSAQDTASVNIIESHLIYLPIILRN